MNTDIYAALSVGRTVFCWTASAGVSKIIRDVAKSYSPTITTWDKVRMVAATLALTGIVNDTIQESAGARYDETVEAVQGLANYIQADKPEEK